MWIVVVALATTCVTALADAFDELVRPALQKHCTKCHGKNGKAKGGVNLLELGSSELLRRKPELIQDLADVIDAREMPPETEPPLPGATREHLLAELKKLLHSSVSESAILAHTPIRRMNRFQYNNAVQDLFDIQIDVFALPERMMREHGRYFDPVTGKLPDKVKVGSRPLGKSQLIGKRLAGVNPFPQDLRAEHGFDNRGDHLSLSPLLLESFFRLSQSIMSSHDFNSRTVGIWKEFFEAPEYPMKEHVQERLRPLLTRAFRRPVEEKMLSRYATQVWSQIQDGTDFTDAMKGAAAAAICSPRFLYLRDGAGNGDGVEALTDIELASRLSFFLWGSGPDDDLIEMARQKRLHEPAMLEEQVDRMLRDRKLKRFCDSFPSQWLQLERIIASVPDPKRYPQFYFAKYRLSMHMMLEPLLLFEAILVENRSILELIDSDITYRSEALDAWYKDQGKTKSRVRPTVVDFARTQLTDRRQGGVITSAAVMTMTSSSVRTQPITRGAWMASVIFNNPPEPPPADVPPLVENDKDTAHLTIREKLAIHRKRADCAGCHVKIDPLGFALENYDPTGFWREKYDNDRPVDVSGELFRKHKFTSIVEFKDAILAEKDRFTRAFAKHVLAFALGREITAADSPALQKITEETRKAGYKMHALIKQIVLSKPFRLKSNAGKPESSH
tara:strand:+ start:2531 stop:4555 length:2025 start_codon:yes stop_codon:yes gene_type:complete